MPLTPRMVLASDGAHVSVLRDSAGLVAQRVVATIVNIGCDIAQQVRRGEIASIAR